VPRVHPHGTISPRSIFSRRVPSGFPAVTPLSHARLCAQTFDFDAASIVLEGADNELRPEIAHENISAANAATRFRNLRHIFVAPRVFIAWRATASMHAPQ
jgi:hypothetical protein